MSKTKPRRNECMKLIEHHWAHARYLGRVSIAFESIYILILGGSLALASERTSLLIILLPFLVLFSVTVVVFEVKYGLEFYHHVQFAIRLAKKMGLEDIMGRPLGLYDGGIKIMDALNPLDAKRRFDDENNITTSPLVSPGHWILFLYIVGFGITVAWTTFAYLQYFNLGGDDRLRLIVSSVFGAILILITVLAAVSYSSIKLQKIDSHLDEVFSEFKKTTFEN